ncbi:phage terminase, small subunit, putative, P27 family [Bradyrhizobium erythrophlei]|nr:phage terminase, small subunit, putative, P27 family [Bradyrhizobium erythrophlei]
MTDFDVIDGGDGTPQQPKWQLLFSDAGECGAAAGHWSNIVNAMRSAETLSVANGHAIKRLVIGQIVFDRACAAVARDGAVRRVKGVDRRNPQWMLVKQSAELCAGIEAELGLPPARRARVGKVPRKQRQRTAADGYPRPVK